jgi:hypothetical protein
MPLGDSGRFTFDFRVPKSGDFDGDNDVDEDDLQLIEAQAAAVKDQRDERFDRSGRCR